MPNQPKSWHDFLRLRYRAFRYWYEWEWRYAPSVIWSNWRNRGHRRSTDGERPF